MSIHFGTPESRPGVGDISAYPLGDFGWGRVLLSQLLVPISLLREVCLHLDRVSLDESDRAFQPLTVLNYGKIRQDLFYCLAALQGIGNAIEGNTGS